MRVAAIADRCWSLVGLLNPEWREKPRRVNALAVTTARSVTISLSAHFCHSAPPPPPTRLRRSSTQRDPSPASSSAAPRRGAILHRPPPPTPAARPFTLPPPPLLGAARSRLRRSLTQRANRGPGAAPLHFGTRDRAMLRRRKPRRGVVAVQESRPPLLKGPTCARSSQPCSGSSMEVKYSQTTSCCGATTQ